MTKLIGVFITRRQEELLNKVAEGLRTMGIEVILVCSGRDKILAVDKKDMIRAMDAVTHLIL